MNSPAGMTRFRTNRDRASLAAPLLPHHRTCGSAPGGSVTYARAGWGFVSLFADGCFAAPRFLRASRYPTLASSAEADWLAHGYPREPRTILPTITVRAFIRCRTNMPSADFCSEIKAPCDAFSHDSVTHNRSPKVKFDRLPYATAEFTASALDGYGLRDHWPARPAPYASHPVLVHRLVRFVPLFFQTPPRDDALALHYHFNLHQVGKRTFTFELSNMLGTPKIDSLRL